MLKVILEICIILAVSAFIAYRKGVDLYPIVQKIKKWFAYKPVRVIVVIVAVIIMARSCGKNSKDTDVPAKEMAETGSLLETEENSESMRYIHDMNNAIETVEENEDAPVWSKEYLFWYLDNEIPDAQSFIEMAQKMLEQKNELEGTEEGVYLKENHKLLKGTYYSLTNEETEYTYMGTLKNNRPFGFGVLWKKYYDYDSDTEYDKLMYCGNFVDGKYGGTGIQFEEQLTDVIRSVLRIGQKENMDDFFYDDYLEPISYIGNFNNGERSGEGIDLIYPEMSSYTKALEYDMREYMYDREIKVYIGTHKKGEKRGSFKIYIDGYLLYEGEMKRDRFQGKGTIYYPDSDQIQYEGEWRNGKYDGTGTLYDKNGQIIYEGKWDKGDYAS